MRPLARSQLAALEQEHWWFRGRRRVCMGLIRAQLAAHGPPTPLARVLDLGAGVGGMLGELSGLCERLVYCEPLPGPLLLARRRGAGDPVLADAEALPWADGSFDLVCLFDVLEHVERDGAALAEVRRVLAPGGLLFLHVPAHPLLFAENDRQSGHHRRYTRAGLAARLAAADLVVERLTHTNALLFPLIAPMVLTLKLCERLGLARGAHTNLSWSRPRFLPGLGRLLEGAFAAELVLSRRFDLPIGHSLAAVARRERDAPSAGAQRVPDPVSVGSVPAASCSP